MRNPITAPGEIGDAMEQQRPLDMGKGLLVHSEKSLSIISNFIKNFLLQISSWAQYSPAHTNRWGRGGATMNQHKNQKQGSQCMLHTTNSQSGPGDSPCNNTIVYIWVPKMWGVEREEKRR